MYMNAHMMNYQTRLCEELIPDALVVCSPSHINSLHFLCHISVPLVILSGVSFYCPDNCRYKP